jgi:peptidoglycan hydrolase-like protein with peptidoglycan-binding domain
MKDVLEESAPALGPLSILALIATAALSFAILYNAFFGQVAGAGRTRFVASQETAGGASTRVDVIVSGNKQGTIVLKYDPRVEEVQRGLLQTGNYKGMVDGVVGNRTRQAIAAYQRSAGLKIDGEVSTELIEHLRYTQQIAAASQFTGSVAGVESNPTEAAELRQVQTGLAELGYAPGEITGDLTSSTTRAIIQFQKDRDLPIDGKISPELLAEISKMSGDSLVATQ